MTQTKAAEVIRVRELTYTYPKAAEPAVRGKLSDLMLMMLGSEGRERTEPEYRELFEGAGLELARVIETESAVSIMEGRVASAA